MSKVVTSRLPDELLKKVDRIVQRGHFRSRSEALRAIIETYLEDHPELLLGEELENLLANAKDLSDDDLEIVGSRLFKGLNVTKIVADGRGP